MFGFVSIITFQEPRVDFPVYNAYHLLIGSQIEGLILFLTLWLILCHPLIKENLKTGLHDTREVFLLMLHWHKKMMINALISRVAYWRYCNLLDCFLNSWFSSALNYIQVKFITYLGQEVLYIFCKLINNSSVLLPTRLCSSGARSPQVTNIWSRATKKEKPSPVQAHRFVNLLIINQFSCQ